MRLKIETSRLILRSFEPTDAEAAFGWFGDPAVRRFTPTGPDASIGQTNARLDKYRKHQISWVAPDAVVQRAMRHSSPETKRHYQLGMVDQVREGIEKANKRAYQNQKLLRFYYGRVKPEKEAGQTSVSC
jgi:hypothetical protein